MFQVNDIVMYHSSEICKVVEVSPKKFPDREERLYYKLNPVYDAKTTIYCPVDSDQITMRRLLSLEDVNRLIQTMPEENAAWIENDQARREKQTGVLKNGDHSELIAMIKTIYARRKEQAAQGRKLHAADERAIAEAEKILYAEFAQVLDIKPEEVVPFIIGEVEPAEAVPVQAL